MTSTTASTIQKLIICGTEVEFPFRPYPAQIAILQRVVRSIEHSQNALIEAATGTGKTLALLCGALAAQKRAIKESTQSNTQQQLTEEEQESPTKVEKCKIFYGTRTHSQVTQVLKELRRSPYSIKTAVLASRDHLCINRNTNSSSNNSNSNTDIDSHCRKLLGSVNSCPYAEKGEKLGKSLFSCSYSKKLKGGCVWDIEELVKLGKREHACPYFASRSASEFADIVVAPYAYLLDWRVREMLGISLNGSVLIIDEAHNACDCLMQSASSDVDPVILQNDAIPSLKSIINNPNNNIMRKKQPQQKDSSCCDDSASGEMTKIQAANCLLPIAVGLAHWATEKANTLEEIDFERRANVWGGEEAINILEAIGITKKSLPHLFEALETISQQQQQQYDNEDDENQNKQPPIKRIHNNDEFLSSQQRDFNDNTLPAKAFHAVNSVLSAAKMLLSHNKQYVSDYRLVLERSPKAGGCWGYSIGLWCLNPAAAFHSISSHARSVILASGTLSPLEPLSKELGAEFIERAELGHVADCANQVFSCVISSGIELTHSHSEEFAIQDSIADSLSSVCKSIPAGILCFFPSHSMLTTMVNRWKSTGVLERNISSMKGGRLFIEERGMSADNFAKMLQDYRNSAPYGAILLAVCRGRASEGVDFSDESARAVVLVGIPYPNIKDLRVTLKREREDTVFKGSGNSWYVAQGIRAANQAIGRVIRHRFDFGAVILLDSRYGKQEIVNLLPKWIRPSLIKVNSISEIAVKLSEFIEKATNFVQDARQKAGLPPLSLSPPPNNPPLSISTTSTSTTTRNQNQSQQRRNTSTGFNEKPTTNSSPAAQLLIASKKRSF